MDVRKVRQVAVREFLATAGTKGFIIGLLFMPAIMTAAFTFVPRLMNQRAAPVEGQVVVVDESGRLAGEAARALGREGLEARRAETARRAQQALPEGARAVAGDAVVRAMPDDPHFTVVPRTAFVRDRERQWLLDRTAVPQHLAVVVIHRAAVERGAAGAYGGYDLYLPVNSPPRVESTIFDALRDVIVRVRTQAVGFSASELEAILRVDRPQALTVAAEGDRANNPGFARVLPFVFMFLLMMAVMIGGQGLMTTTIEEKSSRVVEVMLSAVSPIELMAGKLIGQLGVALLSIGVYLGLGIVALYSFAAIGLIDFSVVGYLLIFFLVTYTLLGSAMMAVGAAVNDMREAQSLMTPITLLMIAPFIVATPVWQNPSSTFAVVLSFIPPMNTFVMLLRLTSTSPPPVWQVWATAGIAALAAAAMVWCASKIYRIGLLMFGKPPDFATLIRWVRAA